MTDALSSPNVHSTFVKSSWLKGAVLAAALTAQVFLAIGLRNTDAAWVEPPRENQTAPDPLIFRILTFGNLPAAVDALWLRVLQDPSLVHVAPGVRAGIFYDLDLATKLDPAFMEAYRAGAGLLAVVRNDGVGARDLLQRGEKFREDELPGYPKEFQERFWPKSWQIPMLLAYTDLFEVKDVPAATEAYRQAANIEGVPPHVKFLSEKLNTREGTFEIARRVLKSLHDNTKDEQLQERYASQAQSLEVSYFLFKVNRAFAEFSAKPGHRDTSRLWADFLKVPGNRATDPWGGILSVDGAGRVTTTTPYDDVMGIN